VARLYEFANAIADAERTADEPGLAWARREAAEMLARLVSPMMPHLAEAGHQVQAGVPYAESLAKLLAGRQCVRAFALGPTGRPTLFEARGAARTDPPLSLHNGSDAAGGRWDHRAFFWKATRKNGQAVYSGPMLSPLTGCLCVIASIAIDVSNQQVLIAVELDWASPDLPWPEADPDLLVADTVTIAVQVMGKLRGTITVPPDAPRDANLAAARAEANVARALQGRRIVKEIYVPNRIVNFVVAG